jgi:hypothetical protein
MLVTKKFTPDQNHNISQRMLLNTVYIEETCPPIIKIKKATITERESVGVDPVPEVTDPGIHPRGVGGAAHAPRHQAHHRPAARIRLAHQR